MKKISKKVLSLLIVLTLLVSTFSFSAVAQTSVGDNLITSSTGWASTDQANLYYDGSKIMAPTGSWGFGYFNKPEFFGAKQFVYSGNIKINSTGHIRLIFKRTDSTGQMCLFTINPNAGSTDIWYLSEGIDGFGQEIRESRQIEGFAIGSTISYRIEVNGENAKIYVNEQMRMAITLSAEAQGLDTRLGVVAGAAFEISNVFVGGFDENLITATSNWASTNQNDLYYANSKLMSPAATWNFGYFNMPEFWGTKNFEYSGNIKINGTGHIRLIFKRTDSSQKMAMFTINPDVSYTSIWYLTDNNLDGLGTAIRDSREIEAFPVGSTISYKIEVIGENAKIFVNGIMRLAVSLSQEAQALDTRLGVMAGAAFEISNIVVGERLTLGGNIINSQTSVNTATPNMVNLQNGVLHSDGIGGESAGKVVIGDLADATRYEISGKINFSNGGTAGWEGARITFKQNKENNKYMCFSMQPAGWGTGNVWSLNYNIDVPNDLNISSSAGTANAFPTGTAVTFKITYNNGIAKLFINNILVLSDSLTAEEQAMDSVFIVRNSNSTFDLTDLNVRVGQTFSPSYNNYSTNTAFSVIGGNGGEDQGLVTTSTNVSQMNKVFFSGMVKFDNIYAQGWDGARFLVKSDGNNKVLFTITNPVAPGSWYLKQVGMGLDIKSSYAIPASLGVVFANKAVEYRIELCKGASVNGNDLVTMYIDGIKIVDNAELSAEDSALPTQFGIVASSCNLTLSNISVSEFNREYTDNSKTYFIKNNGFKATNEVVELGGVKQYFNANSEQATIATFDYTVSSENKITGLSKLMDTTTFKAKIHAANIVTVRLLDKNGVELENGAYVGTGVTIQLVYGNDEIFSTYQAILKGDLDSNGDIELNDLAIIRDYLLESGSIDDNSKLAGDLYGESNITLNSLVGMMAYISEAGVINQ